MNEHKIYAIVKQFLILKKCACCGFFNESELCEDCIDIINDDDFNSDIELSVQSHDVISISSESDIFNENELCKDCIDIINNDDFNSWYLNIRTKSWSNFDFKRIREWNWITRTKGWGDFDFKWFG